MIERGMTEFEAKSLVLRDATILRLCEFMSAEMDKAGAQRPYVYACQPFGGSFYIRVEEL